MFGERKKGTREVIFVSTSWTSTLS